MANPADGLLRRMAGAPTGTSSSSVVYAYAVGASMYGGPSDPSTPGDVGSSGQHLTGKSAFAELGMGTLLGHLPMGTQLFITYKGKTVLATKLDIGLGGAPVGGHPRAIDLWWETAQKLGFNGTGVVTVMRTDGSPIHGIAASRTTAPTHGPGGVAGALDSAAQGIGNAASAVPDAINGLTDAFKFLFSLRFLYVVGGGILVIVALLMIMRASGGSGGGKMKIPPIIPV